MWNKPWSLREGAAVGGGLIAVGLLLQWSAGPVDWDAFAFPVNAAVLAALAAAVGIGYALRSRVYALRFLASPQAAVPAISYAVALTVVMGLVRQAGSSGAPEPVGISRMLSFWPFVLVYLWITLTAGLVAVGQAARISWRRLPSAVCHAGLFVVLAGGALGSADMQRLKMFCEKGQPEWRALDAAGRVHELPVAIELERFIMEEYPAAPTKVRTPGGETAVMSIATPKRFASDVEIYTKAGAGIKATVEVNRPCRVEGWDIYQYSYDESKGALSSYSVFELVSDPWLPVVYAGILLLLAGAAGMLVLTQKGKEAARELG